MTTVDTLLLIAVTCIVSGLVRYFYIKRTRKSYYDKFLRRRVVKEI